MIELTEPQATMLAALRDAGKASPRWIAQLRWPDSPAWKKRTNMHGGHTGAVGGTMPMKAATILWRLHGKGLATIEGYNQWSITSAGRRWLEENNR